MNTPRTVPIPIAAGGARTPVPGRGGGARMSARGRPGRPGSRPLPAALADRHRPREEAPA